MGSNLSSEEKIIIQKIIKSLESGDWDFFRSISCNNFLNDNNMKESFLLSSIEINKWKKNYEIEISIVYSNENNRIVRVFIFQTGSNKNPVQFGFVSRINDKNEIEVEVLAILVNIFYKK